jgi:hypothetical protein
MLKEKSYEIVGIFSNIEELDQAVDELFVHGFDSSSLSVLANEESMGKQLKKQKVDMLADNSKVPRSAFFAEENFSLECGAIISVISYIGAMVAVFANAKGLPFIFTFIIAGVISIFSIILAYIVGKRHKTYIEQQLQKGGLLLWVQLKKESQKTIVIKIFKKNNARKIHLKYAPKKSNSQNFNFNSVL